MSRAQTQTRKRKGRKTKTAEERRAAKGGKPGARPKFKGEMNTYLEDFLPRYEEVREGPEAGQRARFNKLWTDISVGFWDRFTIDEVKDSWGEEVQDYTLDDMVTTVREVR